MESLGIDTNLLIAQLINFVLFSILFTKFMYKPIVKHIAQQKSNEEEKDKILVDLREKENTLNEKERKILTDAKTQAAEIVKKAEEHATVKRTQILDKAKEEAQDIKAKALKDLDDEKNKMYEEVRDHVIKTSETLTAHVLQEYVSENNQKDVLQHVFEKLKTSKVYEN